MAGRRSNHPGGRAAVTHGAHAQPTPQQLEPQRQAIYDVLAAQAPLRAADGSLPVADRAAVELLAVTLARLASIDAYVTEHGVFSSSRGRGDSVLQAEARLQRLALSLMIEMGLTPRSRVALGLDLQRGTDLAAAMSEDDEHRRAEMLREAGLDD